MADYSQDRKVFQISGFRESEECIRQLRPQSQMKMCRRIVYVFTRP